MMRSFMISGSHTCGAELNEGLDRSDMTPFPKENAITIIYGGHRSSGMRRMSSLSPWAPTHYEWGHGGSSV
jgi:hypothetical protein